MKKNAVLFILLPLISLENEDKTLAEKDLKVCSSYFSNSNKEFTDTYLDDYIDGNYH